MEFIREPIEVDFTLISKIWTAEEEKEFSELIIRQKKNRQKTFRQYAKRGEPRCKIKN